MLLSRICLILTCLWFIEGYKILVVSPTPFKSHWNIGSSIVRELAKKGHDLTFVSPYELKVDNVKNILTTRDKKAYANAFNLRFVSALSNFIELPNFVARDVEFTLTHPKVKNLLSSSQPFDAVITEIFQADALFGLGVHFNCPLIGFTTFGESLWSNIITAGPYPASYVPNLFTSHTSEMTFLERLHNSMIWLLEEICWNFIYYPKHEKLYQKFFPNAPPLIDVIKNVSLILNNNHFTTTSIKPSMANVVDIGGIYVEPKAKALPEKFKEFLDTADDGAILFSMGSIIQAVDWPSEKREALTKAFGKLKQKVIWKYENETLPNKPDNVMISPWIPQRDILAHPNIKLFITHGGLLSTSEAIFEGVPILSIPIFGDQKANMIAAQAKGFGKILDFNEINEENSLNAIKNALDDKNLNEKVKEISKIYKDRPMTPQESAVYWVEYVIRHKGAHHLKSSGLKLNYVELRNIDVNFVMGVVVVGVFYGLLKVVAIIFRRIFKRKEKKKIN